MTHRNGHHNGHSALDPAAITLPPGRGRVLMWTLLAAGGACLAVTALMLTTSDDAVLRRHALASYHVGFLWSIGITLGALVFTMILHQTNAGWSALIRRQVENVMDNVLPCLVLFLPVVLVTMFVEPLWKWMDPAVAAHDQLLEVKAPFLNTTFFWARTAFYFITWTWLTRSLYRWSVLQDRTGDKWLTAKMRARSSYGLLLFALTTAFAAFDWMMSLDHHWFSTMFGVYFFACNMGAALSLITLILLALRRNDRFAALVTREHLHDMGKLLFAFSVFWAYIGFSQYFLIWYANLPEETAWFVRRRAGDWNWYSMALPTGRFIVPFFVLMPRPWRRHPRVLAAMAAWILVFHAVDLFWIVRAQVYENPLQPEPFGWLDAVAIAGPALVFLGLVVRRVTSGPLVALKDPRLSESLHHKNYV